MITETINTEETTSDTGVQKKDRLMDVLFKDAPVTFPREGEVVEGVIIKCEGSRIFVDLGNTTGIIYGLEYQLGRHILRSLKEGDMVAAKVTQLENEDGYIELSVSDADMDRRWNEIKEMKAQKTQVALKVLEANKGGLVIEWQGVRGFLPVSQLSQEHYPRVEGGDKQRILSELSKFIGEDFMVIVLDYDQKDEKLIFSEKGSTPEEVKVKLATYKVGEEREGEVSGVVEFGIFVRFEDNLEGLVHISELDWSLVNDPSKLYSVGDKTKVKVIGVEGDKISLSIKALKPDPWKEAGYKKGDIVQGKVTRLSKIGAFIQVLDESKPEISGKLYGLSHISEFGSQEKMDEAVKIDTIYPFQIALIDTEAHKLSLLFLGDEEKKGEKKEAVKEEKEEPKVEEKSAEEEKKEEVKTEEEEK